MRFKYLGAPGSLTRSKPDIRRQLANSEATAKVTTILGKCQTPKAVCERRSVAVPTKVFVAHAAHIRCRCTTRQRATTHLQRCHFGNPARAPRANSRQTFCSATCEHLPAVFGARCPPSNKTCSRHTLR